MLRCKTFFLSLICLSIFATPISAYADEEIKDLIDIAESKGKIMAIIEGGAEKPLPLICGPMRRCYGAARGVI
jgi:hypothetical protein